MYLLNPVESLIVLVWIYTHEEFEGRPDTKSLRSVLKDAINSLPEEIDSAVNIQEQATILENNDTSKPTLN